MDTAMAHGSKGVTRPSDFRDRAGDWYAYYDSERRKEIAAILRDNPEIIEEHEANPIGYRAEHSPKLQRVLNYMRTESALGKYFIYTVEAWKDYRIAVIVDRGQPLELLDDKVFGSEEEAMHGVFMKRVDDILASVD